MADAFILVAENDKDTREAVLRALLREGYQAIHVSTGQETLEQLQRSALDRDWPSLEVLEERYIQRVLAHTRGNKTQAARILGVHRRTLQRFSGKKQRNPSPG